MDTFTLGGPVAAGPCRCPLDALPGLISPPFKIGKRVRACARLPDTPEAVSASRLRWRPSRGRGL